MVSLEALRGVISDGDCRGRERGRYDPANQRVVALSKVNGTYLQQFRLASADKGWADLRGWYVEPGVGGEPDSLVWIGKDAVHRVVLEATTSAPEGSGGPSGSGEASPGASR